MTYKADTEETGFVLRHVLDIGDQSLETLLPVLEEAARLAEGLMVPAFTAGDRIATVLEGDRVVSPTAVATAYRAFTDGGWIGINAPSRFGGSELGLVAKTAVDEYFSGACLSLQMNTLLTQGAIEAIAAHASEHLQQTFLPNLVSGLWNGTMNITEPAAGSDLAKIRTQAISEPDGTFRLHGEKCFISWADCSFTENTIHLALAKVADGDGRLSLFLVPKIIPEGLGATPGRNAVYVTGIEHKLGLKASPTCSVRHDGSIGFLVGQVGKGLTAMFVMMNAARLSVAMEGVGIASAAIQHIGAYLAERNQSGLLQDRPLMRRKLMEAEVHLTVARCLSLAGAMMIESEIREDKRPSNVLVPLAKIAGTAAGAHVADLLIQVHGGLGFVDPALHQYWRDVRASAIYEGTNQIQAIDFVHRKIGDDPDRFLERVFSLPGVAVKGEIGENLQKIVGHISALPSEEREYWAEDVADAVIRLLGQSFLDHGARQRQSWREQADFAHRVLTPTADAIIARLAET